MIYIIRHGKTELNKANALQGRSDYPLTEEGILQAKEAAKKLEGILFSHVFTSPLVRAKDTASIVAPDVKAVTDDRLIEMDYGPYEGMTLQNPAPEVLHFFKDFVHNEAPEGMEPLSSVVKRAGEFIEEIKNLQGNILISTHAILMKGILEYLTPDSNGREEGTLTSSSEVAQYPQGTGAATGSPLRSGRLQEKVRWTFAAPAPFGRGQYWGKYIGNCAIYAADNAGGIVGIPKEIIF